MDRAPPRQDESGRIEIPEFPTRLSSGASVLIAADFDPAAYALGLRVLCQFATSEDTAVIVTTTESAEQTLDRFNSMCSVESRPRVGIVDATSEEQYVSAVYDDCPIVFTPGDLERIVMGLTEITSNNVSAEGTRHLVVRTLSPLLAETPAEAVSNVVARIAELRTASGLGLFGVDFTQHKESTLSALADRVDYLLWVTETGTSTLEFDLRRAGGRHRNLRSKQDD